ncbi:MAG: CsgG/HfaB family protein [Verrucomicrobiota bacterium]
MKKAMMVGKKALAILTVAVAVSAAHAQDEMYPAAILGFHERGAGVEGYGAKVQDILFAELVANPNLFLVDRAEMKKMLDEAELNLSGMVRPDQATQVGQLTGAKILVTGSVIEAGKQIYLVGKIIGTETSRVLGASVKGSMNDELPDLVGELAAQVSEIIGEKADKLMPKRQTRQDRVANLKQVLGEARRPTVFVSVEERHVGQVVIDPAAETELTLLLRQTGFEVIDPERGRKKDADLILTGEGFSEFATRRGNLISVKARLEVKVVDPDTDKVIAADRQVSVQVDLAEQIAGKKALQQAAAELATRLLPRLVEE